MDTLMTWSIIFNITTYSLLLLFDGYMVIKYLII